MKITYQKLGIVCVILFVISILLIGFVLYDLPDNVQENLKTLNKPQVEQVSTIAKKIGLIVGFGLASGLLAILFLMLGAASNDTQSVVYVSQGVQATATDENESEEEIESRNYEHIARLQRLENQILSERTSDIKHSLEKALRILCTELEACQGTVFVADELGGKRFIELYAGYAYCAPETRRLAYEFGEGLAGQVAKEGKMIHLSTVPDNYITILTGLGESSPNHLIIAPMIDPDDQAVKGVIEVASFKPFTPIEEELIQKISTALARLLQEPVQANA